MCVSIVEKQNSWILSQIYLGVHHEVYLEVYHVVYLGVSNALQEVPDLATALKCLLPALGGTYRSVHPLSLFFFFFSPPDGVGDGIFFPSLAGTFTLVETVTAATPFSFFPKPQQLTERVRTLATGCCTLQTPVANCHLQFPESFASLAPPSPF